MRYDEALEYLQKTCSTTCKLGLDRLYKLLELMDHPEKKLKFVHVAGTNGKGSTSVMLSQILSTAGYKTGLYTSPYLEDMNEQIRVNGQMIENEEFAKVCCVVKKACDQLMPEEMPTEFEVLTALAFEHFRQVKCDIVVLETGLGGTLDATNVIDTTLVSVITNIGMDHVNYLGHTLTEIAGCKAGIIKENSLVVSYEQEREVCTVLEDVCAKKNAALTYADFSKIEVHEEHLSMQKFSYKEFEDLSLPLIGEHQRKNAAVALETVLALRTLGYKIADEVVKRALFQVNWPARFEILAKKPLVILDGGHNEQCILEIKKVLQKYIPNKKIIFVLGVMKDKEYKKMIHELVPLAAEFITVEPNNKRALSAVELAIAIHDQNGVATPADSVEDGVMDALDLANPDDVICIIGSLYMAAEVRNCFHIND